jgi:hypothetical protein
MGLRQRSLEKLAYRYYLKNPNRSSEENWKKAEKILNYIDKRKSLIERLLNG